MVRCLTVLTLFGMAAPVAADILVPGSKWVTHVVVFEGTDRYPEYVFYAYPRDLPRNRPGNSTVRVPESGQVTISGFNPLSAREGVYLFAVPRSLHADGGATVNDDWFTGNVEGVLKSAQLVRPIRALPKSDQRHQIETRYKVEINEGLIVTEIKSEEQPQPGSPGSDRAVDADDVMTEEPAGNRWTWIIVGSFAGAALVTAVLLATRGKV